MSTTSGTPDDQIQDDMAAVLQESLRAAAEHLVRSGSTFAPFAVVRDAAGQVESARLDASEDPVAVDAADAHAAIVQVLRERSGDLVAATIVSHLQARSADGEPGPLLVRLEAEHRDEAYATRTVLSRYTVANDTVEFDESPAAEATDRLIWV